MGRNGRKVLGLALVALQFSCAPTRNLGSDEYLLTRTRIHVDEKSINTKELLPFQRQKPNKKVLGVRFHLFLYSLSNPKKEGFPHAWLRRIGEAPVVYDSTLIIKTGEQFTFFMENKGYHYAKVSSDLKKKRKKVKVDYSIESGTPFLLRNIEVHFVDTSIAKYILVSMNESLLKTGNNFDKDILQLERERIEKVMRQNGYFRFRKEYVSYELHRVGQTFEVDLTMRIDESRSGYLDPVTKVRKHQQFVLNHVLIYSDYQHAVKFPRTIDTSLVSATMVLNQKGFYVSPQLLTSKNNCLPGTLFSSLNQTSTYNNYLGLGLFKLVNINFREVPDSYNDSAKLALLDCYIELSPRKRNATQFEIVGTNSAGDLGARANITYNNYNFLHGAERLKVVLTGAVEAVKNREGPQFAPMREFGVETELNIPKFLLPVKASSFIRKYNPNTVIQVSYNYQDKPDYLRTIAKATFGYQWKGNEFNRHWIIPVDFNYVWLPLGVSERIWDDIKDTPLENSYTNHTILGIRYSFEFSNQQIDRRKNFIYFKSNVESAGLLLNAFKSSGSWAGPDTAFFGVPYFQYLRGDVDFRFYNNPFRGNTIVYRLFAGVGYAYGTSESMPFEKMYFAGGPYGIRAWRTRTLGPGGSESNTNKYADNLGDIKLEGNVEYRAKITPKFEAALFLDAGNVWLMRTNLNKVNGEFQWDRFYDQIAVGAGIGARFDFSFFLIRFDFGYKLRDPSLDGKKWWFNSSGSNEPWVFQFGIGYPF